jgi:hypothetical protein
MSQESRPGSAITEATWDEYQHMYGHSPLCDRQEITLWTCASHKSVFSLCSSQVVNRTSGYVQYRASKGGKVVFAFPATKSPPRGFFTYNIWGNGDASIEFSSNGYRYNLIDPMRGSSSVVVSHSRSRAQTTNIACAPNQTLQVNYTLRLLYDSGVWAGR